ncbi:MAG: hemolysin family protein [Lachnospiraceae bacterium]|nr:hemolysin family protein [Lachnospiraceae bacterium]MDY4970564.1 hemolysin family protein [Lachnospiraceae bacterium]
MDPSDAIQLLILILLLILSAFFSSAETALTTVNRIRIRSLAEDGNKRAATVLKILDHQDKMLSAILIGNNIVNLSSSSLATLLATDIFGSAGAGIATGILTLCILVFGEISPKSLAAANSEKLSMLYAGIIYNLMTVLTPVIFIVNLLARGFMWLLHADMDHKDDAYTEDELRVIMDVSHEEGVIESEERRMINNVFDFDDSCAKDIMVPRIDMQFIDVEATYEDVLDAIRTQMYTRMPVYEDTTDNVIGILNIKDLILIGKTEDFQVRNYMREAYYTYEFKKTSELFMDMKNNSISMAIVLDEYGATAGLVTLEDLIEEIVGEIRDEYDADELNDIKKISDREYSIDASMRLDDLNDALNLDFQSEDYDSLGGLVIGLLDRLPEAGETVQDGAYTFTVESIDKNRIERIRLLLPEPEKDEDSQNQEDNKS